MAAKLSARRPRTGPSAFMLAQILGNALLAALVLFTLGMVAGWALGAR